MLAICASDSSIVYYRVTDGLVKPEHPDASDARKREFFQKKEQQRIKIARNIQEFSRKDNDDNPT